MVNFHNAWDGRCTIGYWRTDDVTEEADGSRGGQQLCSLSPGESRDWPLTAQDSYRCFFAATCEPSAGRTILVGTVDASTEHAGNSYTFELRTSPSGQPELGVTLTTPDGRGDVQGAVRTGGVFEPDNPGDGTEGEEEDFDSLNYLASWSTPTLAESKAQTLSTVKGSVADAGAHAEWQTELGRLSDQASKEIRRLQELAEAGAVQAAASESGSHTLYQLQLAHECNAVLDAPPAGSDARAVWSAPSRVEPATCHGIEQRTIIEIVEERTVWTKRGGEVWLRYKPLPGDSKQCWGTAAVRLWNLGARAC